MSKVIYFPTAKAPQARITEKAHADATELFPALCQSCGYQAGVGALSKDEEALVKKYRQLQSKERTQAQRLLTRLLQRSRQRKEHDRLRPDVRF